LPAFVLKFFVNWAQDRLVSRPSSIITEHDNSDRTFDRLSRGNIIRSSRDQNCCIRGATELLLQQQKRDFRRRQCVSY